MTRRISLLCRGHCCSKTSAYITATQPPPDQRTANSPPPPNFSANHRSFVGRSGSCRTNSWGYGEGQCWLWNLTAVLSPTGQPAADNPRPPNFPPCGDASVGRPGRCRSYPWGYGEGRPRLRGIAAGGKYPAPAQPALPRRDRSASPCSSCPVPYPPGCTSPRPTLGARYRCFPRPFYWCLSRAFWTSSSPVCTLGACYCCRPRPFRTHSR
jgi:hypothetical protein